MSDGNVKANKKIILSIIGATIAFGIGSGFATGQEILQLGMVVPRHCVDFYRYYNLYYFQLFCSGILSEV